MPRIKIKFDDSLPREEVVAVLTSSSVDESGEEFMKERRNEFEIQQTSIYGIIAPIIAINNITINFTDVKYFALTNNNSVPQVYLEVYDRYRLTTTIDTPRPDNIVVVQMLPPFEGAYKKIDLNFYISDVSIVKGTNLIKIKGSYKVIDLISKKFECFGKYTTYEIMEKVAKDTKLGFATNLLKNTDDRRYMYCSNESYLDLLNKEIHYSISDKKQIYDFWIDYWNYLNLVNVLDRYTTIENLSLEINKIWISAETKENTMALEPKPVKAPVNLTNHPALVNTDLYIKNYEILNKYGGYYSHGVDVVYSIYEENKNEYIDYLRQNSDFKKDIFIGLDYMGEVYGDYNYILANVDRDIYLKKMNFEVIKVKLENLLISIKKGDKVDFTWYNFDALTRHKYNKYEEAGVIKNEDSLPTNIYIDEQMTSSQEFHYNTNDGEYKIDRTVSGQYMVMSNNICYYNNTWFYELILARPHKDKPKMLNE